jgi:propanol-preferring alcohol dehydrogenase
MFYFGNSKQDVGGTFLRSNKPLIVEEIPTPEIRDDEVLVQIKAVGLCGSDVHIVYEGVTPTAFKPITAGHEPFGVVAAIGKDVHGWNPGDRISITPGIFCGSCSSCINGHGEICLSRKVIGIQRDGALAQYLNITAKNLVRLPDEVSRMVQFVVCLTEGGR